MQAEGSLAGWDRAGLLRGCKDVFLIPGLDLWLLVTDMLYPRGSPMGTPAVFSFSKSQLCESIEFEFFDFLTLADVWAAS